MPRSPTNLFPDDYLLPSADVDMMMMSHEERVIRLVFQPYCRHPYIFVRLASILPTQTDKRKVTGDKAFLEMKSIYFIL